MKTTYTEKTDHMPKRLTEAQQAAYQRDGFVAPIDIFTTDEVAQIHAELDAAEAAHGEQLQAAGRNNAHYVLPVLDRIAHDQRILDAVEDVIGPDILVAGTTLFIKEPETTGFISWHQDARYIGLEPHDWVTAWLAISDVNEENGCMRMVPGTHAAPLVDHVDTFGEDNMLTRGQTVPDVDEAATVPVPSAKPVLLPASVVTSANEFLQHQVSDLARELLDHAEPSKRALDDTIASRGVHTEGPVVIGFGSNESR